ncbi:hypothetical protein JL721_3526 [Aureococcus anophagefferens]|nr:hypothetical protein JL721_3526 [Aureococcus anophagefferens]
MMTIGYARDQFFADCGASSFLIFAQSLIGILLDCVSLGLVYTSLSSGVGRSSTILFSTARASDADAGGRSAFRCDVCGETYEDAGCLARHVATSHRRRRSR